MESFFFFLTSRDILLLKRILQRLLACTGPTVLVSVRPPYCSSCDRRAWIRGNKLKARNLPQSTFFCEFMLLLFKSPTWEFCKQLALCICALCLLCVLSVETSYLNLVFSTGCFVLRSVACQHPVGCPCSAPQGRDKPSRKTVTDLLFTTSSVFVD